MQPPFEAFAERIDGIPGVGRRMDEIWLVEIGADVSRFPPVGLRSALGEAPAAAGNTGDTYFPAQ